MKRAAIFVVAAAMVLSLAACGNRDNKNQNGNNGSPNSGMVGNNNGSNSGSNHNGNGANNNMGGNNNGSANNGGLTGNNGIGNNGSSLNNGSANNSGTANNSGSGRSVGDDLRRAADGVGDAAEDLWDDGRRAVDDLTHSTSSFQRMLDNARVHDTDGILTDGENSRW